MVGKMIIASVLSVLSIVNIGKTENIDVEQNEYWIACGKAYEYNDGLLEAEVIDEDYTEVAIELSDEDIEAIKVTVLGEARGEGFIGMALVMQTIKDTMISEECSAVDVIKNHGYVGKYTKEVNEKTQEKYDSAFKFIFEEGKYVVKHKLKYFYAYKTMYSIFHENRKHIVTYGGHKFFY